MDIDVAGLYKNILELFLTLIPIHLVSNDFKYRKSDHLAGS